MKMITAGSLTRIRRFLPCLLCILLAAGLAACGAMAATSSPHAPEATQEIFPPTQAPAVEPAYSATSAPTATPLATQSASTARPMATQRPEETALVEERIVELEWPRQMRLGDSDTIRLALIPSRNGYIVQAEFPEHQTTSDEIAVPRPGGYDLSAVARLDGAGFDISPQGEQVQGLPLQSAVTWRWTLTPRSAGQHRVSLRLSLRWIPQTAAEKTIRETQIYSRALTVQVASFLGLSTLQAALIGLSGIALGGTCSLPLVMYLLRPRRKLFREQRPNSGVVIEKPPGMILSSGEQTLLRALFHRYARLTLEAEFRSGYSGARAFLTLPVRSDGRADAYTIAKLGKRAAIVREFENYMAFVKDTLPPITARIQETPVTLPSARSWTAKRSGEDQAALRYTFIGEPGRTPTSLRSALAARQDPALLEKLFTTFGPNWWMQHRPLTFWLAQEYDRMLPAHYVIEPASARNAVLLDGNLAPETATVQTGDFVRLRNFHLVERRADGMSLSLAGKTQPGHPPLRIRWLGKSPPEGATGRVTSDREGLLRSTIGDADLHGLPDPLPRVPLLLRERVMGTQSIIHGDLNLENILIGPGDFIWLIDFAQTREGHPLFDFAHLEAEVIAHIIAPHIPAGPDFMALWRGKNTASPFHSLLAAMHDIAAKCLFNPSQPKEYHLALFMACIGALKFTNLDLSQRQLLYFTAALVAQDL